MAVMIIAMNSDLHLGLGTCVASCPSTRSAFFPPQLSQILRCNAVIWAGHYFCGTSDKRSDLRRISKLNTHPATYPGYIAQVPGAPFFFCN